MRICWTTEQGVLNTSVEIFILHRTLLDLTMNPVQPETTETDGAMSQCVELMKRMKMKKRDIPTFEQNLEKLLLSEASQQLIQREEHLFGMKTDAEAATHPDEEMKKLAADYSKLKDIVVQTLEQNLSLSPGEVSTPMLNSAVKVLCQEEKQDELWRLSDRRPPAWRPWDLKKLHDSMLRSLVEERLDKLSCTSVDQVDQLSLQDDITSMGKQLKEDLLFVVYGLKMCYPLEMDICNFYARTFHQTFSTQVRKISDIHRLEDKDCTFLLLWVNEYYPEILQKPELAEEIESEALGKLLPRELLEPLEEQYLSRRQSELMTYIGKVLKEAEQRWNNGEKPKKEYGCYVSPVAYDIIQFINGMVTSAKIVVGDLQKAQTLTCQLKDLMQRFRGFQDDIIRFNGPNSKAYVKAYLSCVKQFRDVLVNNRHLFLEEVQKDCLCVLSDMKQSAHEYLLSSVHKVLKPQYSKLGTYDWLNNSVLDHLLVSIEREIQDFKDLTESCFQELISQLHQEVTVEYVKRLLNGKVKLKNKDQQEYAYTIVKVDADSLHNFFSQMGSEENWLKEILNKIAAVLKLQEVPSIQMEIASLAKAFPDLSEAHVAALLKIKSHLPKAHRKIVKDTLKDVLGEIAVTHAFPFFSKVQVP